MKRKKSFTHLLAGLCLMLLSFNLIWAQTPEGLSYQAVARDGSGNLMNSQNIDVKFEVRETSLSGTVVYDETHVITTNDYGLFSAIIGKGTAGTGVFSNIDWGADDHFLRVLIDTGSGFVIMGTTQLMSVPYSLMSKEAKTAEKATDMQLNELTDVDPASPANGNALKWDGSKWAPAPDDAGASLWSMAGANIFFDTGNVGIGINSPVNPFSILQATGSANTVRIESQNHPTGKDLVELIVPSGATAGSQFIEMQNGSSIVAAVNGDGSAKFKSVQFEDNTVQTTAAIGPIAFGSISTSGTINSGSGNYTVAWVAANNRYEITISGESYHFSSYTSIVTPAHSSVRAVRTSSVSGKFLVYLYNSAGTGIQGNFHFVTYK